MSTQKKQPDIASSELQVAVPKSLFPVSPLAGVLVVVSLYLGSMFVGEGSLSLYTVLRGWSTAQANAWLSNSTISQFLYVVCVEALTLGGLVLFMRRRQLTLRMLGLVKPRLSDFGATLLAYPPYFVLNAVAAVAAGAVFHLNTQQQQQTGFQPTTSTPDLIMTFISLVVLPPLVEEIVMRGFLFGSLKRGMSVIKAALLTSILFASAHLQFGSGAPLLWVAAIDTFILSLVLCYLRQKTGRLWAGIGLHALKNCLAFLAVFVLPHLHYSL